MAEKTKKSDSNIDVEYIRYFTKEWNKVCNSLKNTRYDLSKIKLTIR